jgi:UDP-glucose 4-epimerase
MTVSRAVVTGGAGFIGSHIVDELIERGIETFVMDNFSTGSKKNLSKNEGNSLLHVIRAELRDVNSALREVRDIDVVFHEAAIASVPKSVSDPIAVHDVNVNMTLELLDYCRHHGIKKFIFASSAAVYGVYEKVVAREELTCTPASPYAASKLAVESYLHSYYKTYGLEPVILRYFNVYGPRQLQSDYSGVINIFIKKLLRGEPPVIYGDGNQTRDFVHVKDVVQANLLAMDSSVIGEPLNVASGSSVSIMELFQLLKSIIGAKEIEPHFGPSLPGDPRYGFASLEKTAKRLGYLPRVSIREGLADLVDYFKQTPEIGATISDR